MVWADKILKASMWEVYVTMRARIWLRKMQHVLTDKTIADECARVRTKDGGPLTAQDVIDALTRGEEVRAVLHPPCIPLTMCRRSASSRWSVSRTTICSSSTWLRSSRRGYPSPSGRK